MRFKNTANHYGCIAKTFHWILAVLVIGMIIYGFLMLKLPKAYIPFAVNLHKLIGFSILVLMILRLLWKLCNPDPIFSLNTPLWEKITERFVQGLLYLALIAMPLVGWIGSSSAGKPPHIGDFKIGLPIARSKPLITTAFELHTQLAWVIVALISLHVLAAFFHLFIRKDERFERMLPFKS